MVEFRFESVEKDDPRMEDLFRLRYQVYVNECGFEDKANHKDGREEDVYDKHSSHFCAIAFDPEQPKKSPQIIGTVRMIHGFSEGLPQNKLPIESHCPFWEDEARRLDSFRREGIRFAEISRLAISKDFRKREIDQAIYSSTEVALLEARKLNEQRRQFEGQIVAGLYQCIYQESVTLRLTYWYAVMVRGLFSLLRRWGVIWEKVGEQVEYHGQRTPYLANIEENARSAALLNPRLLEKPVGWKSIDS